jgi:transglutaminase-like putative cysteine protease
MQIRVGCEFVYQAEGATHAVIQVEPRLDGAVRALDEQWANMPQLAMSRYVDGFGNICRRATLPVGTSSLRYDALLEVPEGPDPERLDAPEVAPKDLPDDALVFTLASTFCPTQELADDAWRLFGSIPPGWRRVQAISDWVHSEIIFGYRQTAPFATAADIFKSRAGVCRDFAHLAVTFCRASTFRPVTPSATCPTSPFPPAPIPWISAGGWRCSSAAPGGRSIPATTNDGSVASSSAGAGTPSTWP